MAKNYLHTLQDFVDAYGSEGWGKLAYQGFRRPDQLEAVAGLAKADAPLVTGTSGAYHHIVGAKLWTQLNVEQNIFAALPKEEWNHSAVRVITGFPSSKLETATEGAANPIGDTVLPTFAQYKLKIKILYRNFDTSLQQMFLSQRGEGVTWEQFRDFMGVTFGKGINEMLLAKAGAKDAASTSFNKWHSIDDIGTSNAEFAAFGSEYAVAGEADLYSGEIDRDASSWADGTSLYSSTTRSLSLTLLNDLWRTVNVNTGDYNMGNYFWVTGPETYQAWNELLQPAQRFTDEVASFSPYNGIQVGMNATHGVSFRLGVYERSPILVSNDVGKDTLPRVYLVHKDYTRVRLAQPIVYREVGISTGQELLLNKFGDEGMWYTAGELLTVFPKSVGKLRDLKR